MKKTLPIFEALELVKDNPDLVATINDIALDGAETVTVEFDDEGIQVLNITKDAPTPESSHVPSTDWSKKPRLATFESISKALDEEERYTLSPWYVPDSLDAHDEWTDTKEVQRAFWKYLAQDNRDIRLQHNMDIVAGQWVEGCTFPWELTVPVKHPEGDTEYTFPAGTPFLGIIWEPWAWNLIKQGDIRGLSIGGTANRQDMEMTKEDIDPTGTVTFTKMIRQADGKYELYSHDGKRHLGSFDSEEEAKKREAEINRIKHIKKNAGFVVPTNLIDSDNIFKHAMMFTEPSKEGLASDLCELLGEVIAFRFLAQGFHWNVTGINFNQFHDMFQEIYEDADSSIDPIAENIRRLNFDAPVRLADFMSRVANIQFQDTNDPLLMSQILYVANEQLRCCIVEAFTLATSLNEQGIANFLAERQDMHSKWQWQLRAVVGDEFAGAYEVDVHELGHSLEMGITKHLQGRHDQSSHAQYSGKFGRVKDVAATADKSQAATDRAIAIRAKAAKAEPQITSDLDGIATKLGGKLEGTEYRLKSTDSLARKIEQDAVTHYDGDLDKAAEGISDASRYTITLADENYTDGFEKALTDLEAQGYTVERPKNFWQEGDPYQGVNLKLVKDGQKVELQLHTPESFRIKEKVIHPVYESYRKDTNPVTRRASYNQMVEMAKDIPRPAGYEKLLTLGIPSTQPYEDAPETNS